MRAGGADPVTVLTTLRATSVNNPVFLISSEKAEELKIKIRSSRSVGASRIGEASGEGNWIRRKVCVCVWGGGGGNLPNFLLRRFMT